MDRLAYPLEITSHHASSDSRDKPVELLDRTPVVTGERLFEPA